MALTYPPRVDLACTPTPLQFLSRASQKWGAGHKIWVKRDDMTGSTLSGNKVRKLEFIAAHALENHCDTLITAGGIQSNHCRATAFVGAQLGLSVHLILRGDAPGDSDGNYLLSQLAGARIDCYPSRDFSSNREAIFSKWQAHYAAEGRKALIVPIGGSDEIGIWGYIAACEELALDFAAAGIKQANIITATGSGGTQAGLTLGAKVHGLPANVWGINVCDDEQYFLDKIASDVALWARRYPPQLNIDLQPRVLDGHVGPGYAIATPEIFELIESLSALEGIVLDPVYTGKAFAGMLAEIARGRFDDCEDIVFMHTGGIYGVFPQREGFIKPDNKSNMGL